MIAGKAIITTVMRMFFLVMPIIVLTSDLSTDKNENVSWKCALAIGVAPMIFVIYGGLAFNIQTATKIAILLGILISAIFKFSTISLWDTGNLAMWLSLLAAIREFILNSDDNVVIFKMITGA